MVLVESHDPNWPRLFQEQARRIQLALGVRITAVEHIGSTAIAGLPAKPIVDLAACAAAGVDPFSLEPDIAELGYRQHRTGPKSHAVYVRGTDVGRTDILHVFAAGEWANCNQRVFRDKLLHDDHARQRYGELKTSLADSGITGLKYTASKGQLIEELLNEERASRGLPAVIAWDK